MDLFQTLTDGVDYCDVFISCLDSHSDGTHSGSIDEQVMQCYISPNLMKKQTHPNLGWPEGEQLIFILG